MYKAVFKIEKREPNKMYFSIPDREKKTIEFKVQEKEPIKFKISSNFKMNVEN